MRVEGEDASNYRAVRLDSFANVTLHKLVMADDQTGEVRWHDKAGSLITEVLGQHAIRLVRDQWRRSS